MRSMIELMRYLPFDDGGRTRDLLRKFNQNPQINSKPRSVRDLALSLGFAVSEVNLPSGDAGRLIRDTWAENGFRILVNEALSVMARRFAVLHEMGHYYRHADKDDLLGNVFNLSRSGQVFYISKVEEREANEFAEVLLFGDGSLAAKYSECFGNLPQLSRYYGVSEEVVRIAAKRLLQK